MGPAIKCGEGAKAVGPDTIRRPESSASVNLSYLWEVKSDSRRKILTVRNSSSRHDNDTQTCHTELTLPESLWQPWTTWMTRRNKHPKSHNVSHGRQLCSWLRLKVTTHTKPPTAVSKVHNVCLHLLAHYFRYATATRSNLPKTRQAIDKVSISPSVSVWLYLIIARSVPA